MEGRQAGRKGQDGVKVDDYVARRIGPIYMYFSRAPGVKDRTRGKGTTCV